MIRVGKPSSSCLGALLALSASLLAGAALADAPPQRLIVKYRNANVSADGPVGLQALRNPAARLGVVTSHLRDLQNGAQLMSLSGRRLSRTELQQMAREVAADPNVEYAEEDRLLQPQMTPNDARYNEQWDFFDTTAGMRVPAAWDQASGAGIVVAVVDTGYRPHTDLAVNLYSGYDFISNSLIANDGSGRDSDARDPGDAVSAGECGNGNAASGSSWHGTHVAGTIAAAANNSIGVAGVAYAAKILPVRVLGKCGGYISDIADGVAWASGATVSGVPGNPYPARVINLSLGGSGACGSTMQNAINTARARGAVVVVAAGNSNTDASNSNPANCSGVVVVAATNRSGGRAYYSNYGSIVDVAAPGGAMSSANDPNGILSTLNTGSTTPGSDSYALYQGTSMATPHVAGVVALMLSKNSALTPDQVETLLKSSSRAFPATCSACGAGLVDANAAVTAAIGGAPASSGGSSGGGSSNVSNSGSCASGYTAYSGTLSAGGSAYLPTSSGYSVASSGLHSVLLTVPATGNFDLYLHKQVSGAWSQVTTAATGGVGASESINYTGSKGVYRVKVVAAKGSGAYQVCLKTP